MDNDLHQRIHDLVAEEHELERGMRTGGDATEIARIRIIEMELDRMWDLLRQRNARRTAGQDPADAMVRPSETVESYEQ